MGLMQLWSEHRDAGCPPELTGLRIAGTDAKALDAEITACVSACLSRSFRMDQRVERRLTEVSAALTEVESSLQPEAAHYCARLNRLVGAVLVQNQAGNA